MSIVEFNNPGQFGLVTDVRPHELPFEAWSAGQNVRFGDGRLSKFEGHSEVYDPPTVAPYALFPVPQASAYYWVYAGLTKVYVTDGSTHYNLTRQTASVDVDYSSSAAWNGGVIGGVPVLNNGVDDPQMWSPAATGTRLSSLTYDASNTWSDKGYTAKVIRPFKQFLVALDVTKGADRYPYMVKWSHPAEPGSVPATWDEADATKDAGETDLAETSGFCIDCLPLGDTNVIYKEDSAWGMQYQGGNDIFRFFRLNAFGNRGIIAQRCAVDIGGRHVVLVRGPDLVVHNGSSVESIADMRWQTWLKNNIDSTNYERCYLVANHAKNEVWVCIPQTGEDFPSIALVWNWRENTFGVRDLPGAADIRFGIVDPSEDQTWDADADTWDSDTSTWDERLYNPTVQRLLIADPTNTKLYMGDDTNQFNGSNMTSYVERTGLHTFVSGNRAVATVDDVKEIQRIWPRMTGTGAVSFYVGSQMQVGDSIAWSGPYSFTPGTDKKVDFRAAGKYLGLKIESASDVSWTFHGATLEVVRKGRY